MSKQPFKTDRRTFLKTTSVGLGALLAGRSTTSNGAQPAMALSRQHCDAVNRRRRIVVQYDAHDQLGADFDQWIAYRFDYVDEPGSQIDSLWWDIGALGYAVYPSKVLEPLTHPGLDKWRAQGIDWVERLVAETHRRKLEAFWNHRISEVELNPKTGQGGAWDGWTHPLKQTHPDWVIKTWWKQGLWNLADPGVRRYKLEVLREIAERYPLDGIQVDFARHIPCLPPGRQWELRDGVTELLRMVREMLLEVEKKRGGPFLLAARIPRNLKGCHADGFDIETWARHDLVDILTLGSRTMDVDVEDFRRATAGHNIKLQPCFDDHHTSDAYQYPPIELFRGVFANWWQQGADSVYTFNWSNASPELCKQIGAIPGPESQRQAYHEVGSPETLRLKNKIFPVDRRGGYPWAEGYFNRNDDAQLPVKLAVGGGPAKLRVRIGDPLRALAGSIEQVTLRLVLFGASDGDEIEARLNGETLPVALRDPTWKDRLIFSPKPQPASGGADRIKVNPKQKLLRLEYRVDPRQCHLGENQVSLRLRKLSSGAVSVAVEKLEVHVTYKQA
ncbi:MAG: family 10 glycosylhydrolase [Phycisphaerae bacterium]|nr:family 10 glycosylhydrolase [Phycisphaerae bacterium]